MSKVKTSMPKLAIFLAVFLLVVSCGNKKENRPAPNEVESVELNSPRYVKDNVLVSKILPEIEIQVHDDFTYAGSFDFEILATSGEYPPELQGKPVAAGDRYVFVSADKDSSVTKLFIVQLEGFLADNDYVFNYNFDTAKFIGKNKYRQNTWFYDSKKLAEENPKNEGAMTRAFLEEKGYSLEDQFMMSRFVGLASEDRKHEIIIFYIEMLEKTTGYSLETYENISSKEADSIRNSLIERSVKSFSILKG